MTETATNPAPFRIPLTRADASPRPATEAAPRRSRRTLPAWLPRAVLRRGATFTREDERALRDLRAAQDRSEW
ncbi:hypothetical protein LXM50_01065 [Microbacterium sp. Au-Mic1]|uniref:hypothetical protein n=1 Tax=Microbacterium sp. Au-Mic1 TaxID=2906457 RepID=UPI001E4A13B0|nr:hypothetical protein [Microbacterium sp. Au-Mic1]MCE4024554.1 hypothetical protein [Microbacterium sp. Au-Mic1]